MKTITILSLVDVVGALADDSITNNLYLFDNNKVNGSADQGTGILKTKVNSGDRLIWTLMSLEPESYAAISNITMDTEVCDPEKKTYPDSDIIYWEGIVKKEAPSTFYKITYEVGTQQQAIETNESPALIS